MNSNNHTQQLLKRPCKFIAVNTCTIVLTLLLVWNCFVSIKNAQAQILAETPVETSPVENQPAAQKNQTDSTKKRRALFAPVNGAINRVAVPSTPVSPPVAVRHKENVASNSQTDQALKEAMRLQEKGRYDSAIDVYLHTIEKSRGNRTAAEATLCLATLHIYLKQYEEAAELLQAFQTVYPTYTSVDQAIYLLGVTKNHQEKPREAVTEWRSIVEHFPKSNVWASACFQLAKYNFEQKKYQQAEERLNQWLAAERNSRTLPKSLHASLMDDSKLPVRSDVLFLKAQCAIKQQSWKKVIPPLTLLLQESPKSRYRLPAHFWIAEANAQLGKIITARSQFEQLSLLVVGNEFWEPRVMLRQAQLRAESGEWAAALRLAMKLSKSKPAWQHKDDVELLMGRCYASFGDMDLAREAYRRVLQTPNLKKKISTIQAHWFLGESYMQQKNYAAALPEFLRVARAKGFSKWRVRGLLRAGRCYESMSQWEQAANQYRKANTLVANAAESNEIAKRLEIAARKINLRK